MIEPIKGFSFTGHKRVMSREDIRIIPASNPTGLEKSIENIIGVKPSETVIKKFANGETY